LWAFGDHSIIFRLFFWLEVENPLEMWTMQSELRRLVNKRLQNSDITKPQNAQNVDKQEDSEE
jgi:small-conductance mechanosensitive channel